MLGDEAADTVENDAEQPDREGVDRMAEERRKSLDQADLYKHKAKTDQQEIECAEPCQSNRRLSHRRQCRKDHREQYQQPENPMMVSRVAVASRFPSKMPRRAVTASLIDAGSRALNWLKKKGRSSS